MGRKKGGIPDRWENYSPCGQQIDGTPFIAFKVPLAEHYFATSADVTDVAEVSEWARPWTIKMLKEQQENLTAVIDLTFTDRYYKGDEMMSGNIKHFKIFTRGHEIPNMEVVRKFFTAVDSVIEKKRDCLIGVHCTHGVNRTGYLICRYLIQKMKWEPVRAIQMFAQCRGHPIERPVYLEDLEKANWRDQRLGPVENFGASSSNPNPRRLAGDQNRMGRRGRNGWQGRRKHGEEGQDRPWREQAFQGYQGFHQGFPEIGPRHPYSSYNHGPPSYQGSHPRYSQPYMGPGYYENNRFDHFPPEQQGYGYNRAPWDQTSRPFYRE